METANENSSNSERLIRFYCDVVDRALFASDA